MFSYHIFHLFRISIDHFGRHAHEFPSLSFVDYLQILPIFSWLTCSWWSSLSTILRYSSPCFQHRFPICTFSISSQRWWRPFWLMPFHEFPSTVARLLLRSWLLLVLPSNESPYR